MNKAEAEKRLHALAWLSALRKERPSITKLDAIEQTAVHFDLSPLEEEWLLQQLTAPPSPE
jgi:hypothetical protein